MADELKDILNKTIAQEKERLREFIARQKNINNEIKRTQHKLTQLKHTYKNLYETFSDRGRTRKKIKDTVADVVHEIIRKQETHRMTVYELLDELKRQGRVKDSKSAYSNICRVLSKDSRFLKVPGAVGTYELTQKEVIEDH